MRSYSDTEARIIFERTLLFIMDREITDREVSSSTAEEPLDVIQFIADLEFETKFTMLLRSIRLRWPPIPLDPNREYNNHCELD